ncbi:MAG: hypothetical protein FK734_08200, partial [Asgard group archaeon]|nr:hypothetical protein [Asgard group archaeon]
VEYHYGGDVFISKFAANGSLLWSTYFGGNESESGKGIAVAEDGSCYITGVTQSGDFPILNAYQSTNNGNDDAFVAKFNASGSLLWSTYLGGIYDDSGECIALAENGSCYIIGRTWSTNFPTLDAYDDSYDFCDVFISKFSSNGSLLWSTYFGGEDADYGNSIVVGDDGNFCLTGFTYSTDFPTKNAYDYTKNGDSTTYDVFVSKFFANGSLFWSTFLGGSYEDEGESIAITNDGSCYVSGWTWSSNFPTLNAYDSTYNYHEAFISKFNENGSLLWSTYLGGNNADSANDIAICNVDDSCYITGTTSSTNFPTKYAIDDTFNGGYDAFITKFSSGGSFLWGTYIGGSDGDNGCGIAIGNDISCWVIGSTKSNNFPMKNAYDDTLNGSDDAFITKTIGVEDLLKPNITNITHSPENPTSTNSITISCSVYDDLSGVEFVTLHYRVNNGEWLQLNMTLITGTTTYEMNIGRFNYPSIIEYYITSTDNAGNYAINDNFGNYFILSLLVGDVSNPLIDNVNHNPSNPTTEDSIIISCTVTDESGIQAVILYYRVNNGTWITRVMTSTIPNNYQASLISSLNAKDLVEYYIKATDNAPIPNDAIEDNNGQYYSFIISKPTTNAVYGFFAFLGLIPITIIIIVALKKKIA